MVFEPKLELVFFELVYVELGFLGLGFVLNMLELVLVVVDKLELVLVVVVGILELGQQIHMCFL